MTAPLHLPAGENLSRCGVPVGDLCVACAAQPAPPLDRVLLLSHLERFIDFERGLARATAIHHTVARLRTTLDAARDEVVRLAEGHNLTLRAMDPAPPLDEPGRPPLDPATVAHDKAYMAGLVRGHELEREAQPAPPLDVLDGPVFCGAEKGGDPSTVCAAVGGHANWNPEHYFLPKAMLPTQPAPPLDVERLAEAIDSVAVYADGRLGTSVTADNAEAIAREYAALSEPKP